MCIIGADGVTGCRSHSYDCPVTAILSVDSHPVVSHVVVTAIMSSAGCQAVGARRQIRTSLELTRDPHFGNLLLENNF
jgi:hypothetical protein